MIIKFKLFENNKYDYLVKKIQSVLTPDLLKGIWAKESINPLAGHCYAATEALYWLLGGPNGDFRPYVLNHKIFPEGLNDNETHWFLKNKKTDEILDPTSTQFSYHIPYDKGTPNGMMNYPKGGSKRAKEIIQRINNLNENYLTKKDQPKKSYNEYLYDTWMNDDGIYYICSKCDSYKLVPKQRGGFQPPEWKCDNCGEMNYAPKYMSPEQYKEYIEDKEIQLNRKKYNI